MPNTAGAVARTHGIERLVRKYAVELGLDRDYSERLMRATFIPEPVKNAARLENAKKVARHRDSGTIWGYDRYEYNPEWAASFLTTY